MLLPAVNHLCHLVSAGVCGRVQFQSGLHGRSTNQWSPVQFSVVSFQPARLVSSAANWAKSSSRGVQTLMPMKFWRLDLFYLLLLRVPADTVYQHRMDPDYFSSRVRWAGLCSSGSWCGLCVSLWHWAMSGSWILSCSTWRTLQRGHTHPIIHPTFVHSTFCRLSIQAYPSIIPSPPISRSSSSLHRTHAVISWKLPTFHKCLFFFFKK